MCVSLVCLCLWVCDPGSRCRGLAWPGLAWVLPPLQPSAEPGLTPLPLLLSFRIWAHAESPLHQNCRRNLVVFHAHHHLLLHGKPGSVPHRGEDGVAHRLCWRPGQADEDRVRGGRGWLHHELLQGQLQLDIIKPDTVLSLSSGCFVSTTVIQVHNIKAYDTVLGYCYYTNMSNISNYELNGKYNTHIFYIKYSVHFC